jgi:predicted  nucleic acid-binding Zn-ribbon protein
MGVLLEEALKRLENALSALETSIARRLETERRRSDLEIELQIMQDDRARLAVELDVALSRVNRLEAATSDVGERVRRAIGSIEAVLAGVEEAEAG